MPDTARPQAACEKREARRTAEACPDSGELGYTGAPQMGGRPGGAVKGAGIGENQAGGHDKFHGVPGERRARRD